MTRITLTPSRRGALGLLAGAGAAVAMPSIAKAQKVTWIGASAVAPSDFIAQSIDFFAKRLGELSKGQMTLNNHHGGALGGEREHIEAMLQGAVHFATPGQGLLAGWYRPAEVWTHPYLFKDVPHKDRVWDAVRVEYIADVAKTAKLRPIAAIPRMPRQLSCNKVVKTPADMKGLKIRVPETALWRRTFEMFGSSPTPLPFPEVFQALKSSIIDGQENPIALTWNSGIFDANTHLSLTEHMMQDNCILMGEAVYAKLTPDQQKIVDQAARDAEAEMRPKVVADDKEILDKVKAKKIVISEVDKPAFAATVKTLVNEFPAGKKWVERFAQVS
ncbi:TRAP transporter substrate-binding protein [Enterovirga rhinocerotis]|uniref:Tripartite ATP-independent transporter DctP family solute receptor n=1 Tax=Enterovirga rhinocerotis TaxID=1339210 RepID=A0A4V6PZH3_9HYPH|nr:TRAP transporter substrate-binding protein [Enterovirga rhinocerotis]TDR88159.1 tripartite ATP-independent transporter DctP family solute receptor [Enterovirga rhinocerotis]